MEHESIKSIKKRALILPFIAIIILIIAAGYEFYHSEENSIRKQKYDELSAIAQLKINQITQWRRERLSEAEFFSTNQTFIQYTASLLSSKNTKSLDRYFAKTLLPIGHNHGYGNIYLVSKEDKVLFSLDKNKQTNDIDSITIKDIESAYVNKKIIFSDFHHSAKHKIIHLNIIAPILDKNKIPIAALVFRILPNDYLYPLIRQWPIPSKTSETLVVRKDSDSALFLNNSRFQKNTALNLRIPLTRTNNSEVKAVLGYKGIFEGIDYRGVKTLADIRPIPGTSWFMVSKVDQSEIYSELHFRAIIISILAFVLIFSLGIGLIWFYYLRQRNIYKSLWQTQEEFRTTLYSIGDAVITTDKNGIIKHMNNVAELLTGWNEADANGKPLIQVFQIINEDSRKIIDSPVKKVLSEGLVVGLANHTLLISKDGKETPISDSGAPIKNEENKIIGIVIVFRDQTHERLSRKALQASERKFRRTFELASIGKSLTSLDGNLVDVNDAFCKMIGYSKDELATINFAVITYPDDLEVSKEIVRSLLAGEKESFRLEKRYVRKDGKIIWADVNIMVQKDSGGKPEYFITHINDITERKDVEVALHESESLYRSLFENMIEGFAYCKMIYEDNKPIDFIYLDVNEAFEKLTGLINVTGKRVTEVIPNIKKDSTELFETYGRVALTGIPERFEIYLESLNMWFYISVYSNRKEHFIAVFDVITERKLAEEKILNANRVYSVISQINQAIVRIKDRDELFMEACRIAVEFGKFQMAWFGLVDEQSGIIKPLMHAGIDDGYLSMFNNITVKNIPEGRGPTGTAIREGSYVFCNDIENDPIMAQWKEEALKRNYRSSIALPVKLSGKAIGAFTFYSSILNFFDQEEINLLNEVANDISFFLEAIETDNRRIETELALRESEEKFRMVFENVYDGIAIFSEDNDLSMRRLIECNERYASMSGRTRNELLQIGILQDLQISLEEKSNEKRLEALGKGTAYRGSFSWVRPDGKDNVVEYVGMAVIWRGKPFTVGIDRDITERKRMLDELIQAKEKAENSDKLKSEFLSQVSHEIRTPLVSIVNFTEIIESDIKDGNYVYLPEYMEAISNAGKRIKRTFDLIVNAAQIITHNYEPNLKTINLIKDVLFQVYNEFKTHAEQKGLEYILVDNLNDPYISADEYSVAQLFSNLIDNAIKYTPVGFVKIEIIQKDKTVLVKVLDTGIGISKDFIPYIFEPFRQEEQGYSRKFEGNGLGLTLVKYYCDINNAEINIKSAKGEGTTVTVKFNLVSTKI